MSHSSGLLSVLNRQNAGGGGGGALAFDSSTDITSSGVTVNISNTQGAVNDGIAVVAVSFYPTTRNVSTVTYDGVSLTQVATQTNGSLAEAELWAGAIGNKTSGSKTATITMNASTSEVIAAVAVFANGHQTTPFGTAAKTNYNGTSVSVAPASAVGDIVVDVLGSYTATTKTADSPQVEYFREDNAGSSQDGHGSYKPGAAGTTTIGWSFAGGNQGVQIAAAIKQL